MSTQPGKFSVQLGKKSQAVEIPATSDWKIIEVKNVNLNKGENKLRVLVEQGDFDLDTIQFDVAK